MAQTKYVGTIGKIEPFDETTESWEVYIERVDQYFLCNEIADGKKASAILSLMGAKTYSLLKSLFAPEQPGEKTYAEICDKLKGHLNPKPREIAERFRFMKRNQLESESIADYNAAIRKLAATCNFQDLGKMLRDRLVCGIRSERIQNTLLAKDDLTYDVALSTAVAMETASRDAAELQTQTNSGVHKVNSGYRSRKQANKSKSASCHRCLGKNHPQNECYFKTTKCDFCGKIGHIPRACLSKRQDQNQDNGRVQGGTKTRENRKFQKRNKNRNIHQVDEQSDGSDGECFNVQISSVNSINSANIWLYPKINGHECKFELDTGSAVSVMPVHVFEKHFKREQLSPTKISLRTYTGEQITPVGKLKVNVKLHGQNKKLDLYIINGGNTPLFGRTWMREIKLNWNEIHAMTAANEVNSNSVPQKRGTKARLDSILGKYTDVFAEGIGKLQGFQATLNVKDNTPPRFLKARNVPYAIRPELDKELINLERQGIIKSVPSSRWATPIVPVVKPNGSVRICADFKTTINPVLQGDEYPLPKIEDIFASLAGGERFSKIDLRQAYLHYEVAPEDREYLTINTDKGLFQYQRLVYGIKDAPSKWQKAIEQVLSPLIGNGVQVILDDMIITGPNDEAHLNNLEKVLQKLQDYGLRANLDKCRFFQDRIEFCGHAIDKNGLHETDSKIKAITSMKRPTNKSEIKTFVGMVNYYHKFLPNIASVLRPLHQLTEANRDFKWSEKCESAFKEAKSLIASKRVLTHYDPDLPIIIQTDACENGISGIMSHIMPNGEERPVMFLSRSLTASERNYSQLDREALAIYWTIYKLHHFLYLKKFQLVTDCKALTSIFHPDKGIPQMTAQRLQRYAIFLSGMNYTIKFRTSAENANCDGLSRLPLPYTKERVDPTSEFQIKQIEAVPVNTKRLQNATQRDPVLSKVYNYVLTGKWDNINDPAIAKYHTRRDQLSVQQGCLLCGICVIVPPALQNEVLDMIHEAHPGIVRMKMLSRSHVWWPTINSDIEKLATSCEMCENKMKNPPKGKLHPLGIPRRPMAEGTHRFCSEFPRLQLPCVTRCI